MIISNPVNLAPLLAQMQSSLEAKLNANSENVTQVIETVQTRIDTLDSKSAQIASDVLKVNSEVQTINEHTSTELSKLPTSAIKNIYKGVVRIPKYAREELVTIPIVNVDKTIVRVTGSQLPHGFDLTIDNKSTVKVRVVNDSTYSRIYDVYWEVIELV